MKPSTHGSDSRIISTMLMAAVFLRLQPVRSMQQDMMFSNTARTVETGRKRHEYEEQAAPQTAERHVVKDIRQRDEDQVRTAVRCHAEGKARREDNQTGSKCYERIQNRNIDGLAEQRSGPCRYSCRR